MQRSAHFLIALLFVVTCTTQGQTLWNDMTGSTFPTTGREYSFPTAHRTYQLDMTSMRTLLATAPAEAAGVRIGGVVIMLPTPGGMIEEFSIIATRVMEDGLAAQFPTIHTYSGQGIDDPEATARLDVTPAGFHAMVFSPRGDFLIDPVAQGDLVHYAVYGKDGAIPVRTQEEPCLVPPDPAWAAELRALTASLSQTPIGSQLRTYRLACAGTGEYTAFHGGTVTLGQAAIVTAINRVTGVYEKELGIRLVLVANNSQLVYTNPSTDPYTNNNPGSLLSQNQTNIDQVIGTANYDIGHVFSTAGGGLAALGVVCRSGQKAQGETGTSSPIGDPFYIDYVAHEMGHQFGGNHSFNGNASNCGGGNRHSTTAYEPGSGSTIMAYAGICGAQDLQSNSDAYFHTISFDEIVAYTTTGSGNSCPVVTQTGNNAPAVSAGQGGFTIPISTPFTLTGSGTDPDSDPLTFCWEEFDLGPAGSPETPSGNAPVFRSFTPVSSPSRTFPKLSNLLNNTHTIGELLPTYTRSFVFRLTARDNRNGGGGVNYTSIGFNVTATAGPFLVTSPNTSVSWPALTTQTITWNVAGTTASPVGCQNVKISLSTDGGVTFPVVLAASTPNDGTQDVVIPDNQTTTARIKVEAVGNIFFDISNVNFTIDAPLPVQLALFTGRLVGNRAHLSWTTVSEVNNYGFEVQRSAAADGEFTTLPAGFVAGNGTTTLPHQYEWEDAHATFVERFYRLRQIDLDGTVHLVEPIELALPTDVTETGAPTAFTLAQNFPNPFNPSTRIAYGLPVRLPVKLEVFSALGERIATLVDRVEEAGLHEVTFDASRLANGVYFYRIAAGRFFDAKKFVLVK